MFGFRHLCVARNVRRLLVAGLITIAALAGTSTGVTAATSARPMAPPLRVELWGDSLSAQSVDYFSFYLGISRRATVRTRTFGGTALCSWLPDIVAETNPANRSGFHPQVVLLQFSGNAFGTCMADRKGVPLAGKALIDKYAADSATVIRLFSKLKIPVYFVSSPISRSNAAQYVNGTPLDVMYSRLPAAHPGGLVRFIDAALALEWKGHYTDTLPAVVWEKPTGRWHDGTKTVVVRQADGAHFCPAPVKVVQGVVAQCRVYSGGATRFALAMTSRIIKDYRLS